MQQRKHNLLSLCVICCSVAAIFRHVVVLWGCVLGSCHTDRPPMRVSLVCFVDLAGTVYMRGHTTAHPYVGANLSCQVLMPCADAVSEFASDARLMCPALLVIIY